MSRVIAFAAAATFVFGIATTSLAQNPQRKPGVGPNGQPLRPGMNMQGRPGQFGPGRGGPGSQGGQFGGPGQQRPKPYEVKVSYEAKAKKTATETIKVMAADETHARNLVTAQYGSKVKKFEIVEVSEMETPGRGEGKRPGGPDAKKPGADAKKPAKN